MSKSKHETNCTGDGVSVVLDNTESKSDSEFHDYPIVNGVNQTSITKAVPAAEHTLTNADLNGTKWGTGKAAGATAGSFGTYRIPESTSQTI